MILSNDYMSMCSYVNNYLGKVRSRWMNPPKPPFCEKNVGLRGLGRNENSSAYANSISPVFASMDFTMASDST